MRWGADSENERLDHKCLKICCKGGTSTIPVSPVQSAPFMGVSISSLRNKKEEVVRKGKFWWSEKR